MSRESAIINYVNANTKPVTLDKLTKAVNKETGENYTEAQVYASANQACTKQKIARGPEKNTYCRLDYAGARLSNSRNIPSSEVKTTPIKNMKLVKQQSQDNEYVTVEKKIRKSKSVTNDRFDLPSIIEDLNAAGIEEIEKHKTDTALTFSIMGDHGADYIIDRGTKLYGNVPSRWAKWKVGPGYVIGVYK